jgi:hypothetical protein
MGSHVRRASPVLVLATAVPLIPLIALLAIPQAPSSSCSPSGCRAVVSGAGSSRIPASRVEFAERGIVLLPSPTQTASARAALTGILGLSDG